MALLEKDAAAASGAQALPTAQNAGFRRSASAKLWYGEEEHFFTDRNITVRKQKGPACVSNVLAMLTGESPETFQGGTVNTQAPQSWSDALRQHGMKLAYCNSGSRRLCHFMEELVAYDDLFTVSYYTGDHLNEPDETGWVCGSHIVILHRGLIYDSASGTVTPAREHHGNECYTKRVFRVVPHDYARGI